MIYNYRTKAEHDAACTGYYLDAPQPMEEPGMSCFSKSKTAATFSISGSPTLIRSLLKEQLLDGVRLFVHPIVAATGLPLFGDDPATLKLAGSTTLDNGGAYTAYQPAEN